MGEQVEVIDPVEDYLALLEKVFDFEMLRNFIARPDFSVVFDALHAVTGAYAGPILVEKLGAPPSAVRWAAALHDLILIPVKRRQPSTPYRGSVALGLKTPSRESYFQCHVEMVFPSKTLGAGTQIQI